LKKELVSKAVQRARLNFKGKERKGGGYVFRGRHFTWWNLEKVVQYTVPKKKEFDRGKKGLAAGVRGTGDW